MKKNFNDDFESKNFKNSMEYLTGKNGEITEDHKNIIIKIANEEIANDGMNTKKQLKKITNNKDLYTKGPIRHEVRFNNTDEGYFKLVKNTFKEDNSIILKLENSTFGTLIALKDENLKKLGKPYNLEKEIVVTISKTFDLVKKGEL